jgi:hypothetical protein
MVLLNKARGLRDDIEVMRAAGKIAVVWPDVASAPMERCDIVVPFVAAKEVSTRRDNAADGPAAVHQKYRWSPPCGRPAPSLLAISTLCSRLRVKRVAKQLSRGGKARCLG